MSSGDYENGSARGETSIALAIPTLAKERPARAASLARLMGRVVPGTRTRLFEDRVPNWVLGQMMFAWLGEQADAVSHVGVIQDDVILHPKARDAVRVAVEARPHDIICFHSAHPACRQLFVEGGPAWISLTDACVGTFWLMPSAGMRQFNAWCSGALRPGAVERVHEDDLLGLFAMSTGRRIYYPIVSPGDHDLSIPSEYDNDAAGYRRPAVTMWEAYERDPHARDWSAEETYRTEVAHCGRFYPNLHEHLPLVLRDTAEGVRLAAVARADVCPPRFARWYGRGRA